MCTLYTQLIPTADHTTGHEAAYKYYRQLLLILAHGTPWWWYIFTETHRNFVHTVYMQLMWCIWLVMRVDITGNSTVSNYGLFLRDVQKGE